MHFVSENIKLPTLSKMANIYFSNFRYFVYHFSELFALKVCTAAYFGYGEEITKIDQILGTLSQNLELVLLAIVYFCFSSLSV